jgi:hypothetical protein
MNEAHVRVEAGLNLSPTHHPQAPLGQDLCDQVYGEDAGYVPPGENTSRPDSGACKPVAPRLHR